MPRKRKPGIPMHKIPGIKRNEQHDVGSFDEVLHTLKYAYQAKTIHVLSTPEKEGLRVFVPGIMPELVTPDTVGFFTADGCFWYTWSMYTTTTGVSMLIAFDVPIRALTLDECYIKAVIRIGVRWLQQLEEMTVVQKIKLDPILLEHNLGMVNRKIDFALKNLAPHVYYTN